MNLLTVTALFVRLFGIYIVLRSVWMGTAQSMFSGYVSDSAHGVIPYLNGPLILLVLAGAAMIAFPVSISKYLLPRTSEASPALSEGVSSVEVCAYTVIGVFILSFAIPDLVYNAMSYFLLTSDEYVAENLRQGTITNLVTTVVEISIGTYLALGAPRVAALIRKVRGIGA